MSIESKCSGLWQPKTAITIPLGLQRPDEPNSKTIHDSTINNLPDRLPKRSSLVLRRSLEMAHPRALLTGTFDIVADRLVCRGLARADELTRH